MQEPSPVNEAFVSPIFVYILTAFIFACITVLIARHKKDNRVVLWFGIGFILGPIGWIVALFFAKPHAGEV